jgi:hypothetical protein
VSPICATCPSFPIPLDLMVQIFGGEYKSWSFYFMQYYTVSEARRHKFWSEYIPKFVFLLRYSVLYQHIGTEPHNGSLLAVNIHISVASPFPLLMFCKVSITAVSIVCKKVGLFSVRPPSSFQKN